MISCLLSIAIQACLVVTKTQVFVSLSQTPDIECECDQLSETKHRRRLQCDAEQTNIELLCTALQFTLM